MPKDRDAVNLKSCSYIGIGHSRGNAWQGAPGRRMGSALSCMFACLLIGAGLAGCSVSMPMASLIPDRHEDDITGTIAEPQLAGWIDAADWQHAKTAFSQALAAKTSAPMAWDNPQSGDRGSFTALGQAYPGTAGICRAFHADIDRQKSDQALEGTACAGKSGTWQVTEIKAANKG